MTDVSDWDANASGNNDPPPNGFPEGQSPPSVNNAAREVMAAVRRFYLDAEYIDPVKSQTVTRDSATVMRIAALDATAWFAANRRLKLTGGASAQFGRVDSVTFSSPDTLVTVVLDGGATILVGQNRIFSYLNASIQDAAFKQVGTGATQLPTNADLPVLGTAALLDHGTAAGELPKNSDLGAQAFSAEPGDTYDERTSGDLTSVNTVNKSFPWEAADLADGHLFQGADTSKNYYVMAMFELQGPTSGAVDWHIEVRIGLTGTTSDTTVIQRLSTTTGSASWEQNMTLFFRVDAPAPADLVTFVHRVSAGSNGIVKGGTTVNRKATLHIWEAR